MRSALAAASDTPLRHGWADVQGGWSQVGGAYGLGEVGVHLAQPLSVVGVGGWSQAVGWHAGAGVRVTW